MKEYTTVVFVSEDIYDDIELYRHFLEKEKFETALSETCFIKMNKAGEYSPADFGNIKNLFFIYGLIEEEEYRFQKAEIDKKYVEDPNPYYYMLFCQKQYNKNGPYDDSLEIRPECGGGVPAIAVIENNKEEGYEDIPEESLETLRCLKLLSLVIAICNENKNNPLTIGKSYVTAAIYPNYKNIYYAILCTLSEFADQINIINLEIDEKRKLITFLEDCKPKKCEANFTTTPDLPDAEGSDLLENTKDVLLLSRNMGVEYDRGIEKIRKSISLDLQVAHKALASAEEYDPICVLSDENCEYVEVEGKGSESVRYMMIYDADEKDIATGDDLLDRPDQNVMFDAKKIEAVLPLAREFKKTDKPKPNGIAIVSVCAVIAFAVCVCSVYLARWLKHGVVASVPSDFFEMIAIPVIAMLAVAVAVFLVSLIRYLVFKQTFKKIRDALRKFLNESSNMYTSIREYINKYLTVYYNYHIRLSRIEQLKDDVLVLESKIQKIKKEALPYEILAGNIVASLDSKDNELDFLKVEDGSKLALLEKKFIEKICENSKMKCEWYDSRNTDLVNPWISSLKIEVGSFSKKEKGGSQ